MTLFKICETTWEDMVQDETNSGAEDQTKHRK